MSWSKRRTIDGVGRVILGVSPREVPLTSGATSIKFVIEGSERYVTPAGEHWVRAGQFAVVQPGTQLIGGSPREQSLGLCLYLDGEWQGGKGDDLLDAFQTFTSYGTPTGRVLLEAAARLMREQDPHDALSAGVLREVGRSLPELSADFGARSGRLGRVRPSTRHELFRRVETARAQLHAVRRQPTSLSELAAAVNLSPFHLARAFKAMHGVSPIEYHTHLRLEIGRDLLHEGQSAAEVATELGYSEPSAFSRAFRRRYGVPPGAIRARSVNASRPTP